MMSDKIEQWPLSKLLPYEKNPRKNDHAVEKIAKAIQHFGFRVPVLAKSDGSLVDGHLRLKAAQFLGMETVPVILCDDMSDEDIKAFRISINKMADLAEWDQELLNSELSELVDLGFDVTLTGFDYLPTILDNDSPPFESDQDKENQQQKNQETKKVTLSEKFGVVPFSVLNAREGWWQSRKKSWLSIGIKSEVGRGDNLLKMSDTPPEPDPEKRKVLKGTPSNPESIPGYYEKIKGGMTREEIIQEHERSGSAITSGTSVFDPVLCELAYKWFSPPGGLIVDPFAGGSVRGVVAGKLGRSYRGVDLREEQVFANREQAKTICPDADVKWFSADSRTIDSVLNGTKADFIFSCPPYADLEVYSDHELDLSTLSYPEFKKAYFEIIKNTCSLLKENSFACFVVGDVRDKNGNYYNFVGDTVEAFRAAGLEYYVEAVLVTAVGTLAIRTERTFRATRKLGKTHQNVLVFLKGDAKKATQLLGECEFGQIKEEEEEQEQSEKEMTEFGEKLTADSLAGEV